MPAKSRQVAGMARSYISSRLPVPAELAREFCVAEQPHQLGLIYPLLA